MPNLYETFGGGESGFGIPGSPKHSRGLTLSTAQLHANDIDVHEWLAEIDMNMYADVFLRNFGIFETNFLNRKHLAKVRLQDLPRMGITQLHHAKLINEHIHHTLQFEFGSPVRRKHVDKKMRDLFPEKYPDIDHVPKKIGKLKVEDLHIPERNVEQNREKTKHRKMSRARRRSFDKQAWANISHLRTADVGSHEASELLRDGDAAMATKIETEKEETRRRRSFDNKIHQKGKQYGDRALLSDMVHRELHGLQREHLKVLKSMIGCEYAHAYFVNEKTGDLLMFVPDQHTWYRMDRGMSLAGACAECGHTVNVEDAYTDGRFNINVDIRTGIKSKEVLAMPLRGSKGGGQVKGVVVLTNKAGGFDTHDEETAVTAVQRISEALFSKFKELNEIADIMSGSAIFIAERGGEVKAKRASSPGPHYLQETEESLHQSTSKVEMSSEMPMHMGMDVQLDLGYGDTH